MKKLVFLALFSLLFAFDFTFTKAFEEFNKGLRLEKNDIQKAQEHFKKSFEYINELKDKNTSQVNYMLGKMYCNGWGVEQNYSLAEKYFKNALELGNKRAYCCLARLYLKIGDIQKAQKYLKYAKSHKEIANYCKDINEIKEQQ